MDGVVSARGVWWTWGPMDGVVSAHAGSVVVCGGHGVKWMVWSMHILAMRLCVVDSVHGGSMVVYGGQGVGNEIYDISS